MDGKSLDITQERLNKLKEILPDAFTEGKIDWEKLQASLGENIEFKNERYVLNWAGKSDAFRVLQSPTTATLVPCKEESVGFDDTENIFIEGENLEVLKVLQKSYFGKIKMIYIDPPYNTGNDKFIYPDKFSESRDEYLSRIGDRDETGYMTREGLFRTNSKDSGHYHSNWLSMMYPRLFLARNLLKEVFGEENFVANFPRVTKKAGKTTDTIAKNNDYVLCYQKTENSELNSYSHTDEGYKNCDEFEEIRGKYKLSQPLDYGSIQYSPSLDYEIEIKGMVLRPGNVESKEMDERKKRNPSSGFCWRWSKDLYQFGLKNGFIVLKESKNGFRIYTKTYEKATISKNNNGYFVEIKQRTKSATTLDFIENEYSNDNSRKDIGKVFDGKVFEYSKPVSLIKTLLFLSSNDSDIILDFFSGSCTTAQAVLDINNEDSGSRKFICVQLPEKCDENSEAYKAGYKTIAEIGKERIRRVIKRIKEDKQTKLDVDSNLGKGDLGFKVFKLQESNFKIWRSDVKTEEELYTQLTLHTDPVDENAKIENILYELLLKSGVPLTARIEEKDGYYRVNNGEIILILKRIDEGIIKTVISEKPKKLITLDRLFKNNDQLKTNTALQLKDSEIDFRVV